MFRIVFLFLMFASVFFAVYNPGLPGMLLLIVELFFIVVSLVSLLRLRRGTRIFYRDDAQGATVRVENHSGVPLVRMYIEVVLKEKWTGKEKKSKLMMQADSQSEETFVIRATRLSGRDDYYDGVPYLDAASKNQQLRVAVPNGASELTIRRIVYYEPLGLFSKSTSIGKTITLYQFPEWIDIPLREKEAEDSLGMPKYSSILLRSGLTGVSSEKLENWQIDVYLSAVLSIGLSIVSRGIRLSVSIPQKGIVDVQNEEDMYSALKSVMDLKPGMRASDAEGFDATIAFNLKPALLFEGRVVALSSKRWKKELQETFAG